MPTQTQEYTASVAIAPTHVTGPITFPKFNMPSGADLTEVKLFVHWKHTASGEGNNLSPAVGDLDASWTATAKVLNPDASVLMSGVLTTTITGTVPPAGTETITTQSEGSQTKSSADNELSIPQFIGTGNITFTADMIAMVTVGGDSNMSGTYRSSGEFDAKLTYMYNT